MEISNKPHTTKKVHFSDVEEANPHAQSMYALLKKNNLGILRHNPRTLSYEQLSVDGTSDARRYSPILRNLKACFYSNWRYVKRNRGTSSMELGISFHRHVYHSALCVPREQCTCVQKYGVQTKRAVHGSALHTALLQRKYFLEDFNLKPFASEVIAVSDTLNVGTAVDELAWQTDINPFTKKTQQLLWLISWKTGYSIAPTSARTNDGSTFMKGNAVSDVKCSAENQHFLQLLAEEKLLNENGIYPDVCVIVYVLRDTKNNSYVERFKYHGPFDTPKKSNLVWDEFKEYCRIRLKTRTTNTTTSVKDGIVSNLTRLVRSLQNTARSSRRAHKSGRKFGRVRKTLNNKYKKS